MRLFIYSIFILFCIGFIHAIELKYIVDLNCSWRFEIGDNPEFAEPDFDDSKWQEILVPGAWENKGFPGYDGYAWYRVQIKLSETLNLDNLYLQLGWIDDVDQAFINGNLIGGTGKFPPDYETAYDVMRLYRIDKKILWAGKVNTIAIRVYDGHLGGGIVGGDIGIFRRMDIIDMEFDLSGQWKFSTGDCPGCLSITYDDHDWDILTVPMDWDKQGFDSYKGYAIYRKHLSIPAAMSEKQLILLLGCIGDMDETFFNGQRIGGTGSFPIDNHSGESAFSAERAYPIPSPLIRYGAENVIVVRVFSNGDRSGIYRGFVGIVDQAKYKSYCRPRIQK